MLKRALLTIAVMVSVFGLLSKVLNPYAILYFDLAIIFLVLAIAVAPGIGCAGGGHIVLFTIFMALFLIFIAAFSVEIGIYQPSEVNMCHVTMTDMNGTIVSKYDTVC